MICRYKIKCSTCSEPYTFRIAIGHSEKQAHTVFCKKCGEEMIVVLHLDQSKGSGEIEYVENCSSNDQEGHIVNLHPEFTVPDALRHQDGISVSILRSQELFNKTDHAQIDQLLREENREDFANHVNAIFQTDVEWKALNKAWSQFNKENYQRADQIAQQNSTNFKVDGDTVEEWIFSFCHRLLSPNASGLFKNAIEKIARTKKMNPKEYFEFLSYHNNEVYKNNLKRSYEIVREFFQVYDDMKSVLWHFKIKGNVPIDGDVSSVNFKRTRKLYGDIFEGLMVNFVTLALLSNIIKGRHFDQFSQMKLSQYLGIDKAGRAKCFEDIQEFAALTTCIDSTIRNASHHAAFEYDYRTGLIHYRSGGDGSRREMRYPDYIYRCVSIFLSSISMTCIDLMLHQDYMDNNP